MTDKRFKTIKTINNIKRIRQRHKHKSNTLVFSWHRHNQMQLYIDGEQFYPAILQAINAAQQSIFIEMYLVQSGAITDHFIDALTHKAQQGIDVRLVFDDFGAAGLLRHDRQRLRNVGVALRFYNPVRLVKFKRNLRRTHRKIIVIDSKIAFEYCHLSDIKSRRMRESASPIALNLTKPLTFKHFNRITTFQVKGRLKR